MSEHLVDSTPSIIEVRNVLGLSSSPTHLLTDIGGATTNDCADPGGDIAAPIHLLEWAGYNHAATPAAPSGFSGNPSNSSSPSEQQSQDSHVYMSWSTVSCAVDYHVMAASGSGGSFIKLASTLEEEFYVDDLEDAEESRYYKIIAQALLDGSAPGADSAELHLKTTPSHPKSPVADGGDGGTDPPGDCTTGNITITVSWNNGASPGIRVSEVEWRWKKIPVGGGASYSEYLGPTAVGATSFTQDVGAASGHVHEDEFGFELRYVDGGGGSGSPVSATSSLFCPD